jgi:predicted nucleic acid-binding protein
VIVLDASAAIELAMNRDVGAEVARRLDDAQTVHVPHLFAVEVAQGLRRLAAVGVTTPERAAEALLDVAELDAVRHEHEPFLARIWELRDNLTAYDAAYVALAEALDVSLVTLDARLATAPGHRARVELIA